MRLIKMTGGLGNQMFIYAMYLNMRRRFPNTRIDLSDMVHYNVHNGYEMHRVFQLPKEEFCINQKVKKVVEFLFFKTILERKQNLETLEAYRRPYLWPLIYFKGFYQSERYFVDVAGEVREAFAFHPELASEQTRKLAEQIKADTLAVSLHVRRGDYLQPSVWRNTGGVCCLPYYKRAIAEMQRRVGGAHFYVFSDDPEWCRANLPLDETAVFVDWNKKADSWQDMMLMSLCRHNIICNSTFSWWGAWLNNNPGKTVLAPDRWSLLYPTPYLNCPSWIPVSTENKPDEA
ncbi:MAG: alpha-1,2-fucosyltransferase [Alloprevotella sp.]